MKKTNQRTLVAAAVLLAVFALFTVAVCTVDVQFAGPDGSQVGFATVNTAFHTCTGVHLSLYVLTDWLGLVPLAIAFTFALFGLFQWIRRRSLRRVDRSILLLGVFYLLVMAAYLLFEKFAVNFRPIRIDGYLEASYPSSTTLLVLSICPTAMLQWHARIRKRILRRAGEGLLAVFCAFMGYGKTALRRALADGYRGRNAAQRCACGAVCCCVWSAGRGIGTYPYRITVQHLPGIPMYYGDFSFFEKNRK